MDDFENKRTLQKDPWLAVFLGVVVLPGLGHMYLRRWIAGVVFLLAFLAISLAGVRLNWAAIAAVMLCGFAVAHLCQGYRPFRDGSGYPWVPFAAVLVGLCFLRSLVAPQAIGHFVGFYSRSEGPSMEPTFGNGSRVLVDRFTYHWREPAPGEIIIFTPPKGSAADRGIPICKRIIAVGGQTVQVCGNEDYVDGQARRFAPLSGAAGGSMVRVPTNLDPRYHRYFVYGVDEPYRVPDGCYFLVGDNRQMGLSI